MKINNLYEIHFSPTGGTKEAVDVFSAQWNIPKSIIDLADMNVEFDKYEFYGDDLCVIGVPSFGGRVPAVAIQRIRQLKANNTPAIIIATYGNRNYDDTLVELQEIVENVGFCVVAALAVVTQHSIFPQIATGRPDAIDKSKLAEMAIKIKVHIERANGFNKAKLSCENKQYKEYKGVPLKPVTSSKCMKCGICANNCPVGAIPLDNPKVTDNEKCISCMRCVRRCPKGARKISELKLAVIALKIKKECQDRKDIEIFVNKNINKNTENEIVQENCNIVYDNVDSSMSLEGIEEISVTDFSLEDAKRDKDDVGVPTSIKIDTKKISKKTFSTDILKEINKIPETKEKAETKEKVIKQKPIEKKINVKEKIEYIDKMLNGKDKINDNKEKPIEKTINKQSLPNTLADMNILLNNNPKPLKAKEEPKEIPKPKLPTMDLRVKEEVKVELKKDDILQDIADIEREVYEPKEITVPENMKNVELADIENDPYELDEDLLDEDEIDDILELDEITEEYNEMQVEDPKDFVLNISTELEDIEVDEENIDTPEEIEDLLGIILEDK